MNNGKLRHLMDAISFNVKEAEARKIHEEFTQVFSATNLYDDIIIEQGSVKVNELNKSIDGLLEWLNNHTHNYEQLNYEKNKSDWKLGSGLISNGQPIVHVKNVQVAVNHAKDRLLDSLERLIDGPNHVETNDPDVYKYSVKFVAHDETGSERTAAILCDHKWEKYFGLSSFPQYKFCTKCDVKDHNV